MIQHLQQSAILLAKNNYTGESSSLLRPIKGVYDASDINQRNQYKYLALNLLNRYSLLRENRDSYLLLQRRHCLLFSEITHDEHQKFSQSISEINNNEVGDIISCEQQLTEKSHASLNQSLKTIGQRKEMTQTAIAISALESSEAALIAETDLVVTNLATSGYLSESNQLSCMNNTVELLNSRFFHFSICSGGYTPMISRSIIPSVCKIRKSISYNFRLLWTSSGHALNPAYCTMIDSSCRFAITGADDYLVKVWNIEKGQLVMTCRGHNAYITIVALSSDNSLLASACTLGVIRIWRLRDGRCLQVLKHGTGGRSNTAVNWIAFDKTNCALASVGDDGRCIVWDLTRYLCDENVVAIGHLPLLDELRQDLDQRTERSSVNPELPSASSTVGIQSSINSNQPMKTTVDEPLKSPLASGCISYSDNSSNGCSGYMDANSSNSAVLYENEAKLEASVDENIRIDGNIQDFVAYDERESGILNSVNTFDDTLKDCKSSSQEPISFHTESHSRKPFRSLFDWSSNSSGGTLPSPRRLVLPHIRDNLAIVDSTEVENVIRVQCLDISPLGGVLATGCEDGIVRMWRYGSITTDEQSRNKRDLKSDWKDRELVALRILRKDLTPRELERFESVASHMLSRLEGHVAAVTDLRFSNLGDRIVTGSLLDGTVRIWAFTKDFKKNEHIVLSMVDDDEEASVQQRGGGPTAGRRNVNRKKNKPQVNSTCWTMDDCRVITLQSVPSVGTVGYSTATNSNLASTRLKVWDSVTGDLLRLIPTVCSVTAKVIRSTVYDSSECLRFLSYFCLMRLTAGVEPSSLGPSCDRSRG